MDEPRRRGASPFTGIGSEGFVAVEMGRKFVGAELKAVPTLSKAAKNIAAAEQENTDLFAA